MTHNEHEDPIPATPEAESSRAMIRVEFPSFQELIDSCAERMAEDGIRLPTESQAPTGSVIEFAVGVTDGFVVLRGSGEVVGQEGGLLVRFLELDGPTSRLLPKILDVYRRKNISLLNLSPIDASREEAVSKELEWRVGGKSSAEKLPLSPAPQEMVPEESQILEDGAGWVESDQGEKILDPGLSWLPEAPEPRPKREVWIFIALAVLGALLGVVFYLFVLRPELTPTPQEIESEAVTQPSRAAGRQSLSETPPGEGERVQPRSSADAPSETENQGTLPTRSAPGERESSPGATPTLTGVDLITWDESAEETIVTLWADGSLEGERVEQHQLLDENPRVLIKIYGLSRPSPQTRVDLESTHVRTIRTGFHRETGIPVLHVVADLVDDAVRLQRTETEGSLMRIYFSRPG